MKTNKVLVIGGDGFLGGHVVTELLSRSYEVTVLVQPFRRSEALRALPVNLVPGDLTDLKSLQAAVAGHTFVINLAGVTDIWPARGGHYEQVNVFGVANLIEACLAAKVHKVVHTGSANSFGFGSLTHPGNEDTPWTSFVYGLDNIDTKHEGQRLFLNAVAFRNLPGLVVAPTFMIGPGDSKPSSGELIIRQYEGKLPLISPGGKNWAYVKDVAVGVCNALERGKTGECYLLGGKNMTYKEALARISLATGVQGPRFTAPPWIVRMVGAFGSAYAALTRKKPMLYLPTARVACDGHYFSSEKAIRELGLPQTPIQQAFEEAVEWYRAHGMMHAERAGIPLPYQGKVVWVTGSSRGIGKAVARRFGELGATVVLNSRNPVALEGAMAELTADGIKAVALAGDVSQWEVCKKIMNEITHRFGRLDVLVNNAGMANRGGLDEVSPEVLEMIVKVNVLGAVYPTKAAMAALRQTKGSVVNISSIATFFGVPFNGIYSASKQALTAFTEAVRLENADKGVHAGIAYLGFTENDPGKIILDTDGQSIYLDERRGILKMKPAQVAQNIDWMVRSKKGSITLTSLGMLLAAVKRVTPWLAERLVRYQLPTIRKQSQGTPRYVG